MHYNDIKSLKISYRIESHYNISKYVFRIAINIGDDGLPLHVHVGDEELRGVGVHGSLGQLDVARHGAAESC